MQTYRKVLIIYMFNRYILSSVCLRMNQFSQLSLIQYIFSLSIYLVMIVRIRVLLSPYHHQIGSMNNFRWFMMRSLNNGVRCMFSYDLISSVSDFLSDLRWFVLFLVHLAIEITYDRFWFDLWNWFFVCFNYNNNIYEFCKLKERPGTWTGRTLPRNIVILTAWFTL